MALDVRSSSSRRRLASFSRAGRERRDRPRLLGAPVVEAALGLAQPPAPALRGRQLAAAARRRARSPNCSSSSASTRVGLLEDLARDLLVVAVGVLGRVGVHLGAVDRDHLDLHQPGLGAQLEHLAEQLAQRRLVALAKARDRRVIRRLVGRDHAHRDVLMAAPLDPPRRPLPDRVGVEQQRDHHRRIVRRPAPPVVAIAGQERRQIHRLDGVEHEPREVILRQPLAQTRRQQQLLLAITRDEVLRHPEWS